MMSSITTSRGGDSADPGVSDPQPARPLPRVVARWRGQPAIEACDNDYCSAPVCTSHCIGYVECPMYCPGPSN